jgi:hypothetical protein
MDYGLMTFDGGHFAHIYAREEHRRLQRITTDCLRLVTRR